MTTKNANGHRILPVGLCGSTLIKKNYKIEMGGTPFRRYALITQNSYWARTRKQWIRQTCSNEKAVTQPAERRTGIIANQRQVVDLKFSGIANSLF